MQYNDRILRLRSRVEQIILAVGGQEVDFDAVFEQTAYPLGLGERALRNVLAYHARRGRLTWINDYVFRVHESTGFMLAEKRLQEEAEEKKAKAEAKFDELLSVKPVKKGKDGE